MLATTITTLLLALSATASPTGTKRAVPQTIQLTARKVSAEHTKFRRALSPIGVPLADYFNGTDLQ